MKVQGVFIYIFLLFFSGVTSAQTITIGATDVPLNKVLRKLIKEHGVALSFNDRLLKECKVNSTQTFDSPEEAIQSLASNCGFAVKKKGGVLLITSGEARSKKERFQYSGVVMDYSTGESLPFAGIQTSMGGFVSDQNGRFSFYSEKDQEEIQVTYLGYMIADTNVYPFSRHTIGLRPSFVQMEEVVIDAKVMEEEVHVGQKAGLMKITHQLADQIPGNNDQSVFNLLRLQPGVQAAGEQSQDYMIWGAYKGQTHILYDGITLFNISNQQNNIGTVNPLMIQDMEVYKGGYNAELGGRVGGVINMISKDGDTSGVGGELKMNNQTINGKLNVPLTKQSVLQVNYRQTYNEVEGVETQLDPKLSDEEDDYKVVPGRYDFKDLSVKYSGCLNNQDRFFISYLSSTDRDNVMEYNGSKLYELKSTNLFEQAGASIGYEKKWRNGANTDIVLSGSDLLNDYDQTILYNDEGEENYEAGVENAVFERSIKIDHRLVIKRGHAISFGMEMISNSSSYEQEGDIKIGKSVGDTINRGVFYLKDQINIGAKFSIEPGVRMDYLEFGSTYFQPRVGLKYRLSNALELTGATGLYNQYMTEGAIVDPFGQYHYYWQVATETESIPVQEGYHVVSGVSYHVPSFLFHVEGFYREVDGMLRWYLTDKGGMSTSGGWGRSYGLDFYVKKRIEKHHFWLAYTLSKAEERFDHFSAFELRDAPQDQRHELKATGLLNLDPIYFSASYIYGSGLPDFVKDNSERIPYKRLDVSAQYRFKVKGLKFETGLSVMNVLNHKNVRYNNFFQVQDGERSYIGATPFTPLLFLNAEF